ncbi:MAG TPA: class I SAM-dependent RNA methyltransferase [Gemmatimonadaceae bacterium]|nr:class I SAM-dependent RNA methyltransferase [Gemmatimonadaceae bacterium]
MTSSRDIARYDAFAVTAPGLAPLAAGELARLGLSVREVEAGGVAFEGDFRALCLANLQLRTVSRVLVRVDEFRAATFHELEKRTARIDWARWLSPGREVTLRVTCRKSRLYHSGAVAERVAAVLTAGGGRVHVGGADDDEAPNEPGAEAPQLVVVRLLHDRCTVSLDSSGPLLHQRGYRLATGKAPLRETLGAALLLASGWEPGTPLVDPFCGSGTLAIEGALLARRLAPGRHRRFALERWPAADAAAMARVRDDARGRERPSAGAPIVASDRDAGTIEGARANAERAGVAGDITFAVRAVSHLVPPDEGGVAGAVVTNPPYGLRVDGAGELRNLYARTGAVLRERFAGWRVALVSADRRLTGQLGIPLRDALTTSNGGIPVAFAVGALPLAP